jgi:tRNA-dihydrouridine synthase A
MPLVPAPTAVSRAAPVIPERLSVAPMMDRTDRHFRYFMRLLAPGVRLYTEMVTAQAVRHGDPVRLLGFDPHEQPVALQLGGSDPGLLASATRMGVELGYAEVNLNCGCPSPRVTDGRFGACLMAEPTLVADCVRAMREAAGTVPVTVKTRIGIDERDSFEELLHFVGTLVEAGVEHLIVHARKAWLSGLSPKENREVPPLRYEVVYRLGEAFPDLEFAINGGFTEEAPVREALDQVHAVMIGRAAWDDPWFMARLDDQLAGREETPRSEHRRAVLSAYADYAEAQRAQGVHPRALLRHLHGLFRGEPGSRPWRRSLAEGMQQDAPVKTLIDAALAAVESAHATETRSAAEGDAGERPTSRRAC